MSHIVDNITSEGNASVLNYREQITSQATANSTLTLTIASTGKQRFTGSTTGQIVNLGNATNYLAGQQWTIINDSTVSIVVSNSGGTPLLSNLQPTHRATYILADNTTANGVWVLSDISSTIAATLGGFFIANFNATANSVNNSFLNTFGVAASDTAPATIPVTGVLSRVTIMLAGVGTGTFEFRVNTSVGAAAFTATLTAQQSNSVAVSYNVSAGDTVNCKVASGASGISKPNVNIYI